MSMDRHSSGISSSVIGDDIVGRFDNVLVDQQDTNC